MNGIACTKEEREAACKIKIYKSDAENAKDRKDDLQGKEGNETGEDGGGTAEDERRTRAGDVGGGGRGSTRGTSSGAGGNSGRAAVGRRGTSTGGLSRSGGLGGSTGRLSGSGGLSWGSRAGLSGRRRGLSRGSGARTATTTARLLALSGFQAVAEGVVRAESTAERRGVSPKIALLGVSAASGLGACRECSLEGGGLAETLLDVGISQSVGALRESGAVLGVLLEIRLRLVDLGDSAGQSAVGDRLSADKSGEEGSGNDVLHFGRMVRLRANAKEIKREFFDISTRTRVEISALDSF